MSKKNLGSSIDDFLKKENIFEEAQAIKEVVNLHVLGLFPPGLVR
jgi:hypothetical protein